MRKKTVQGRDLLHPRARSVPSSEAAPLGASCKPDPHGIFMTQHRAARDVVILCGLCAVTALQNEHKRNSCALRGQHSEPYHKACITPVSCNRKLLIRCKHGPDPDAASVTLTKNFGHLAHPFPTDEH